MRSLAQSLMEWPPLVRVYESRFWRRSPLFAALFGISFEREYSLITAAANLKGDERLLDLGCGPGIYARRFARRLPRGHVTGIDLSAPMLRYASKRAQTDGLTNLQLIRGDAMELPFRSEAFRAVNCCGALHLFPDPGHVLKEIHRVLGAGGSLTLATFRHAENPLARLRADIRRQLYGLGSFSANDLNSMLTTAGFYVSGRWPARRGQKCRPLRPNSCTTTTAGRSSVSLVGLPFLIAALVVAHLRDHYLYAGLALILSGEVLRIWAAGHLK